MLSICIPIYNFNITGLVNDLCTQINKSDPPVEIILIDDYSDKTFRLENQIIHASIKYIQLDENIGRSRIRNLFLQYVKFEYLLFLDCDSIITSQNFVQNYIDVIKNQDVQVVCGGRLYPDDKPQKDHILRWKYGRNKESRDALTRSQNPNKSFMTNNFLIKRTLLKAIPFDERFVRYGHEDTLLGYQLKINGIEITHIENPVLNGDIEDNALFIEKTEQGILNLIKIISFHDFSEGIIDDVNLLKVYKNISKWHLKLIVELFFLLSGKAIKSSLINRYSNLILFDIYKMGYLNHHLLKSN